MTNAQWTSLRNTSAVSSNINWREMSDRQLVELCSKWNEDAWAELLLRYHLLINAVLARTLRRSMAPTANLLTDLFQEVLVKLCANACRPLRELEWRHNGSLRGLLRVVSSSVAQDHIRRCFTHGRDQRRERPLDEHSCRLQARDPLYTVENKIFLEQLIRYIAKSLGSESNRNPDLAMFLLYYKSGLTASELARLYHLGVKTVENKLARLVRLARRLVF